MIQEVNDKNFKKIIKEQKKPILVDFWASWCGPCVSLSKVIDEIENKYKNDILIIKINIDENSEATNEYKIKSIPTLIFVKNGKEKYRKIGISSFRDIEKCILSITK